MADFLQYWFTEIMRHVPTVTWVGLTLCLVLLGIWFGKRWRDAALLASVCAAYALTPYIPSWH